MTTGKPLTAAERLRAFITGQVGRMATLEMELHDANESAANLQRALDDAKAELAPFRAIADEFAPESEAEPGDGTLDAAA